MPNTQERPRGPARHAALKLLASVLVVAGMAGGIVAATFSAFSSTGQTTGDNAFAAGTVSLSTNGTGAVVLSLTNAKPGDSITRCIKINYTGTLAATVKMTSTSTAGSGGDLTPYLATTIQRGSFTGATPPGNKCATTAGDAGDPSSFVSDATGPTNNGVLFNNNLSTFPSGGIADPAASWAQGDSVIYRFAVTLQDVDDAQGKATTTTFTWKATNS